MTATPWSSAFCTAGATASLSCARTISTLAPFGTRLSISVACFSAEDCASAEIYCAPPFSNAALIAASSVFQRSSWKLFHDTPTINGAADTVMVESPSPATAIDASSTFLTCSLSLMRANGPNDNNTHKRQLRTGVLDADHGGFPR